MLASCSHRDTRALSTDMYNSLLNSHDVNFRTRGCWVMSMTTFRFWTWTSCWNQKPFPAGKIRNTAAIQRGIGHGRIPLIDVHRWQGDIGYRSAAWLTDWAHSLVLNLYGFISFYMGNPTLTEKYHICGVHVDRLQAHRFQREFLF